MNLIQDPWLDYIHRNGDIKKRPITAICDPDVVDFSLPRADFYGAAYQFAIGLLQTAFAPKDLSQWHHYFKTPPADVVLEEAFNQVSHAFNVVGEGPLFMQDFDSLEDAPSTTVSGLLIEAPGANGIKNNTDHFIKRGIGQVLSLDMAALALFTMQINAPAGGSGHRVGLRGGGPLTTLVMPVTSEASLWEKLWLNIINKDFWRYPPPNFTDGSVFPWLAPTQTSEKKGSEVYANAVHPLHVYWAMPRRIRLEVEHRDAECQLLGQQVEQVVNYYRTQNYGANYDGEWSHPLTPYRFNPKKPEEPPFSVKAQPGGITYKIWDTLTLRSDVQGYKCAKVISHYYALSQRHGKLLGYSPRLKAFGYDMDNMKARGWYNSELPLFAFSEEQQEDVLTAVNTLQDLSVKSLKQLRDQIKNAWFDRPKDAKGDTSFIDLAFWQKTESGFFTAVSQLIENIEQEDEILTPEQAKKWLNTLRAVCFDLFDGYAMTELGNARNMARRIKARQTLSWWLFNSKDIKAFIREHDIAIDKEIA
ncbi:type I-E CRISPR-associated protein Cse1/CasA [Salinivibrio kushneri]|uniref:type I-E CRISPR-associated protein Cse1/CasA n=1 Tax=Salinivibrio kushneri TaxID=1908198 RepID=UPI000C816EC7|nr:type I-E CRISPR-associated protein Cse1/CasA [Salinivibrio kushneri]